MVLSRVNKIIIALLLVVVVSIVGALLFVISFEEKLKSIVLNQINTQLTVPLEVEQIELSILKKFPHASLHFTNAVIAPKGDTLLHFKDFYLKFNVLDIYRGDYIVREVEVIKGKLNFLRNKKGEENYHILKETPEDTTEMKLQLEKVHFENVAIKNIDERKNEKLEFELKDVYFRGNFSEDEYSMDIYGPFYLKEYCSANFCMAANMNLDIDAGIAVNGGNFHLQRGKITINEVLPFEIKGSVKTTENTLVDLKVTSSETDLDVLKSIIPQVYQSSFQSYDLSGIANINLSISGESSETKTPEINLDFQIKNGQFKHVESGIELDNLNASGMVFNGEGGNQKSGKLEIKELNAVFDGRPISAYFLYQNFLNPGIHLNMKGSARLEAIKSFLELDSLDYFEGETQFDLEYIGQIKSLSEFTKEELDGLRSKGEIKLENIHFKKTGLEFEVENLNGEMLLKGNELGLKNMNLQLNKTEFKLDAIINEWLSSFYYKEVPIRIRGKVDVPTFDMNTFFKSESNEGSQGGVPPNTFINLLLSVDTFRWDKFMANNIVTEFYLEPGSITASPLKFNSSKGEIKAGLKIVSEGEINKAAMVGEVSQIDIKNLFYEFGNFGQEMIQDKHISGKASATCKLNFSFDQEFNFMEDKLSGTVLLKIENGELINFEPLYDISSYIQKNKIYNKFIDVKTLNERMKHIRFSTLENELKIENSTIFIPYMSIMTNLLELNIEGWHKFNNQADYNLDFYLSDILRLEKREESEFVSTDKRGKTRIFMTMKGDASDPDIELVKTNHKEITKEEVKDEKSEVKKVLNQEFGLFGKDTSIHQTDEKPKEDFIMEWEEFEEKKPESETPKQETEKPSGLKGILNPKKDDKKEKGKEIDFSEEDF